MYIMRKLGLIKWFDNEKGFGKLGLPDNSEVFLLRNNIQNPDKEIKEKQAFIFDVVEGNKGPKAINAKRPVTNEDFEFVMTYLNEKQTVGFEETVKSTQHVKKNYYKTITSKEIIQYNIISYGISPILLTKNSLEIFSLFKNYYDSKIDLKDYQLIQAYIKRTIITVTGRKIELAGFLLDNFQTKNSDFFNYSSITNEQKQFFHLLLKFS